MQPDKSQQLAVCVRLNVEPQLPPRGAKLGIALATIGLEPLNGLRHPPEEGTSGWFIGAEWSFPRTPISFSRFIFLICQLNVPGPFRTWRCRLDGDSWSLQPTKTFGSIRRFWCFERAA